MPDLNEIEKLKKFFELFPTTLEKVQEAFIKQEKMYPNFREGYVINKEQLREILFSKRREAQSLG